MNIIGSSKKVTINSCEINSIERKIFKIIIALTKLIILFTEKLFVSIYSHHRKSIFYLLNRLQQTKKNPKNYFLYIILE